MTYPGTYPSATPSGPGYPTPPQPGGYGAPFAPGFPPSPNRPSKTPALLTAAVAVLGIAAYLASFGPLLSINTDIGPFGGAEFTASGLSYWTVAALLAALLAAVALLPRAKSYTTVTAVAAVLGVLLVIGQMVNRPTGFAIGWALWLVLAFTVLQAIAAVGALLLETGVITPPAPRPQFGQYGPPPGYYYPPGQPGQPGQPGGYPYGGPVRFDSGFDSGDGPSTPPTGFPAAENRPTPSPSPSPQPEPEARHRSGSEPS
ncbi:MAG: DUF5336 domain-containing protein [Mycobacterium sp.]